MLSKGPARIVVGALALAAALAVGCGGGDDSGSSPADTVQSFYDAYASEDAAGICATFSARFQAAVQEDADSCEAAFQESFDAGSNPPPSGLTIGETTIDGDTATVEVTAGTGVKNTAALVNEDGWKINNLSTVDKGDSIDTEG
jgi:hypothetical protein